MGTYGNSKATVLAVVKETTINTPVDPTGATDYVSVTADPPMKSEFEEVANDERRASIGMAKSLQGIESVPGQVPHYLKHSGTEGTAPETGDLLESAFGTVTANGTQRTTTTGSTTSLIELGAGGSDFNRGFAILLKDTTNGYSIRPVHSKSSNQLTLGFRVPTAPATGMGVGKCVNYSPANSGHPPLSIHKYHGNGQAYEMASGCLVEELNLAATAGRNLEMNFSYRGMKHYFNPIRIASADRYLDFNDNGTERAAIVAAGVYRDPHELANALQDAMNSLGSANTFTVTYNDNNATLFGKFTIASSHATFGLLFNTGANTANTIANAIGFTVADETGAQSYNSDTVLSWAAPHTPTYDATDPIVAKNLEVLLGDVNDYLCFCASTITVKMTNVLADNKCVCAENGIEQRRVGRRMVEVNLTALLDKHDAEKYKNFRSNGEVRFAFNFGLKDGTNWMAGYCGSLYIPTAVIAQHELIDSDDLVGLNLTLKAFVDSSGNGEVYLNFL